MTVSPDTIRVLHVDDEPDFADMTATFLEREDDRITVHTATDASEGLDRLVADGADCIVSDYDMPDRNGIEFLDAVREEYPDLPFILYTGQGSEKVAADAISAGVTDYLQKESGTDQYAILANRIRNAVEQVRAERERERMRERMELALEHTDSVIFELDLDTGEVIRHGAFDRFFELPATEVPTWEDHLDRAVHPDDQEEFHRFYRQLIDGEREGGTLEYRTHSGHGHVRWIRDTIAVQSEAADDPRHAVGIARDITAHKKREQELQRKERRYQAVFNDPNILVGLIDTDGTVLDINQTAMEYIDAARVEVVGDPFWETPWFDHSEATQQAVKDWIDRAASGEYVEFEADLVRPDGDPYTVEGVFRPVTNEDGEVVSLLISDRDITERTERERELEQQTATLETVTTRLEEQYRTLFEEAPVMAVVTRVEDGRPVVEDCNTQFLDTLGYEKETVVGSELATYYTPASRERLLDEGGYERSLEGDFTREHRELLTADGEVVETLLRAVPRRDADGDAVGTMAMYVDITEQEAVKRANERLEEFTSIVSHDLRNPLNVAQGRLELAREECDSEHLDSVARAHERMAVLIDDLLTLARQGEEATDVEPVHLLDCADTCWGNVETADATLVCDTDRKFVADRSQLQQLLENLYRNAVEHGGEDVTITVGALDDGFYVEDDGPGIPPDEREDVFDAGYSTSQEGTGFGLSIVRQVVEAHGWEISVTDGETGGARFEITGVEFAAG